MDLNKKYRFKDTPTWNNSLFNIVGIVCEAYKIDSMFVYVRYEQNGWIYDKPIFIETFKTELEII